MKRKVVVAVVQVDIPVPVVMAAMDKVIPVQALSQPQVRVAVEQVAQPCMALKAAMAMLVLVEVEVAALDCWVKAQMEWLQPIPLGRLSQPAVAVDQEATLVEQPLVDLLLQIVAVQVVFMVAVRAAQPALDKAGHLQFTRWPVVAVQCASCGQELMQPLEHFLQPTQLIFLMQWRVKLLLACLAPIHGQHLQVCTMYQWLLLAPAAVVLQTTEAVRVAGLVGGTIFQLCPETVIVLL
jgi:hypothetical protein